jgi:hypothetical protein
VKTWHLLAALVYVIYTGIANVGQSARIGELERQVVELNVWIAGHRPETVCDPETDTAKLYAHTLRRPL